MGLLLVSIIPKLKKEIILKYNILIIEDEFPTRELLKSYLSQWPEAEIPQVATTGKEALELVRSRHFAVIFLDINLPDMSGLEIMKRLSSLQNSYVIFSTAYNQHALEALDAGAVDYLLKPYSLERFNQAMAKAVVFLNHNQGEELTIRTVNPAAKIIVSLDEIIYLSSNGKRSIFHTSQGDYETPGLLKEYLNELPKNIFLRIHKRHIVNRNYISSISYANGGSWNLLLKDIDDTLLPVGKIYAGAIKKIFGATPENQQG